VIDLCIILQALNSYSLFCMSSLIILWISLPKKKVLTVIVSKTLCPNRKCKDTEII
jgi:hypothetical protein